MKAIWVSKDDTAGTLYSLPRRAKEKHTIPLVPAQNKKC
jgi:hypothetical protein